MSCALAFAQASYLGYYQQPHAVIGPNGHPVETPEVQYAKATHFAAHANARYGGAHGIPHAPISLHNALPADTPEVAAAKLQHHHDFAVAAQRNGVHVPLVAAAATHYPLDTPEVSAAKAAHFAAHAAARGHYRRRRAAPFPLHYPVIDHNGVPVETPEVQAAKAQHYSEYQRTLARPGQNIPDPLEHTYSSSQYSVPQYNGPSQQYSPYIYRGPGGPPAQIGPDGRPLETPEIQAAKAAHFAAHAAVRSGNYGHFGGHY